MTYETINAAMPEFRVVVDRLQQMEQPLPNIFLPTIAFTAFDEGKAVGCGLLQCVPVIEPFTVDEKYSGGLVAPHLFKMAQEYIEEVGVPRVFMHSEDARMQRMLVRAGARPTNQTWFEFRREWGG